nr:tyrosine-protein phosphatase [uncultured Actinoplanes sp.]
MPLLRWPDLRNARDLGGLPAAGGGRIRERALIRTDNHGRLDATGIPTLLAYGVSRVVDLRWHWEAAQFPSPLAADERYRHLPACCDLTGGGMTPADLDGLRARLIGAVSPRGRRTAGPAR